MRFASSLPVTFWKSGQSKIDGIVKPGILPEVGREICERVQRVGNGEPTKSEALGHQEFILTYKSFEPLGPVCLLV